MACQGAHLPKPPCQNEEVLYGMLTNDPELAIVCQSCGQERAGILLSRDTDLYLCPAILTNHCKALQQKRGQVQAESLPTCKP